MENRRRRWLLDWQPASLHALYDCGSREGSMLDIYLLLKTWVGMDYRWWRFIISRVDNEGEVRIVQGGWSYFINRIP
jgi:hypothetical protein